MNTRHVFKVLPDTAIVTDQFGYIIDFNHCEPFAGMKKGQHIRKYIHMELEENDCELQIGGRYYNLRITHIMEGSVYTACIFYLIDITQIRLVIKENKRRQEELLRLNKELTRVNRDLRDYAEQIEILTDYYGQMQLAKEIHDGDGHAITVLHTISQMCRKLIGKDRERYTSLILQGQEICSERHRGQNKTFRSITEGLSYFVVGKLFDIDLSIRGDEPQWAAGYADMLVSVCEEAYHNTLNHSLAEKFFIKASFEAEWVRLVLCDDGRCHGSFKKGFGLSAIEENVYMAGGTAEFTANEGEGFLIDIKLKAEGNDENSKSIDSR
ncbi:MAG: hypothetical protein GX663_02795 [Clostridiales bacterium]|nr:hypothetical protein [Clostridiales bacterium]